MKSVRYHIAILDDRIDRRGRIAIENDLAALYGVFLVHISQETRSKTENVDSHIVLLGAVPELAGKNVKQLSATPSFFAVRVVCEVIGHHLSQAIFFEVWSRPGIAWGGDDFWRRLEHFSSSRFKRGMFDHSQGRANGGQTASTHEMCEDPR